MGSAIQISARAVPEPSNDNVLTTGTPSQAEVEKEKICIQEWESSKSQIVPGRVVKGRYFHSLHGALPTSLLGTVEFSLKTGPRASYSNL